jgi:transposase
VTDTDKMPLSPGERGKIVGMIEAGLTVSQISREMNLNKSTVYYWIKRFREGDETFATRSRSGRPRCTSQGDDDRIRQRALDNPLSVGGAAAIKRTLDLNCSTRAVRNRLHEAGMRNCRPARKPAISEVNKRVRLDFAHSYAAMDQAYWDIMIFSDEKTFRSDTNGHVQLWRTRNSR